MTNKNKLIKLLFLLSFAWSFAFVLQGCFAGQNPEPKPVDHVIPPRCDSTVQYSATSISVNGVTLPIPGHPVTIGGVLVQPKTIQQASEIIQIIDINWVHQCKLIPSLASVSTKEEMFKIFQGMEQYLMIENQFALTVASNNGGAIQQFVKDYFNQAFALTPKIAFSKFSKESKPPEAFAPLKKLKIFPLKELFSKK